MSSVNRLRNEQKSSLHNVSRAILTIIKSHKASQIFPKLTSYSNHCYALDSIISLCDSIKKDIQTLRKYELRTLEYLKSLDECQNRVEEVRSQAVNMMMERDLLGKKRVKNKYEY